jgi:hypothetical protein
MVSWDPVSGQALSAFVLLVSTLLLRFIVREESARELGMVLCCRLARMFLFTASAHWGKRRGDLIAMVPRVFRRPDLMPHAGRCC